MKNLPADTVKFKFSDVADRLVCTGEVKAQLLEAYEAPDAEVTPA